jgi:hypothetical protein
VPSLQATRGWKRMRNCKDSLWLPALVPVDVAQCHSCYERTGLRGPPPPTHHHLLHWLFHLQGWYCFGEPCELCAAQLTMDCVVQLPYWLSGPVPVEEGLRRVDAQWTTVKHVVGDLRPQGQQPQTRVGRWALPGE